ncbi:MAG: CHC2 zinc finger domain-containing protein [Burkholderiales bacterium]
MARIPEAEIERIKREVSLERLVEASGVELKKRGKDLFGRCPFHEPDETPSFSVTPAKNLWNCLGACNEGGDVFAWVMKRNGVSFRHAYELLREGLGAVGASPVKKTTVRSLPAPVSFDVDDQALRNQVALVYYAGELKRSPEALAYLKARGIDHPEAIDKFRLGFANRTLGLRLPNSQRVTGSQIRERLQRVGILRESGHEHFNGALVIPVVDEAGNVVEMYGRRIVRPASTRAAKHLYLPEVCRGPSRGVWNWEALVASKEVILCEALIDALTFWCAGFRNVTSSYGAGVFTEEMLAAMKRHGTERVLIAYDRDEPGEKGAADVAERLIAAGIEAWRVEFPKGMDANEYALKVQPAAKALGVAVRKAAWLGKGKAPEVSPTSAPIAVDVERPAPVVEEPRAPVRARAASSLAAELAAKEKTEPEPQSEPEPEIEAQPAPASPVAPAPSASDDEPEVSEAEIAASYGERSYRVRGLAKNTSYEILKVNVLAARGERFHVDTVDLRNSKQRTSYVMQAALELQVREDIVKDDLGKLFHKLEALRDEAIARAMQPKASPAVAMAEPEREAAMALLRSPQLIERILADLEACGLVGERVNKLVGYLAATSRKLDSPLAVLVQSSSASGKSTLMDAVLALMPEEERVKYSAMTGQALFYLGERDLKHKILAIVEEEGAARASYALKLLQSEGELTIASTGKDPATGNLVAQPYRVEGPTMLFTTTTAAEIDPELQNRCLVLAVDESREQTQAIHRLQRDKRTLEGMARKAKKKDLARLHQNAQRLLKPLEVLNPYSDRLTFPDQATRMRRDHEKYLTLIDVIALVHQHQRELKLTVREGQPIEYVEATLADVALANDLAHEVLGRSLDELPPQTRRVLEAVDAFVAARAKAQAIERAQVRFSRRELREASALGDTQLKIHLGRLVEFEYVLAHRRGAACDYELVYDGAGQDGRPFVPGLIDVQALRATATTADRSGVNDDRSAPGRGPVGPRSGGGRGDENALSVRDESDSEPAAEKTSKTHIKGGNGKERVVPLAAASRDADDDAAP